MSLALRTILLSDITWHGHHKWSCFVSSNNLHKIVNGIKITALIAFSFNLICQAALSCKRGLTDVDETKMLEYCFASAGTILTLTLVWEAGDILRFLQIGILMKLFLQLMLVVGWLGLVFNGATLSCCRYA